MQFDQVIFNSTVTPGIIQRTKVAREGREGGGREKVKGCLPSRMACSEIINYAHRAQTSTRTRISVAGGCFGPFRPRRPKKEEAWHTSRGNYTRYFFSFFFSTAAVIPGKRNSRTWTDNFRREYQCLRRSDNAP